MSSSQVYVNFQFLRESSIPIKYKRIRSKFLRGTKHPQFKVYTKPQPHNHTLNTHMNIFFPVIAYKVRLEGNCEKYILVQDLKIEIYVLNRFLFTLSSNLLYSIIPLSSYFPFLIFQFLIFMIHPCGNYSCCPLFIFLLYSDSFLFLLNLLCYKCCKLVVLRLLYLCFEPPSLPLFI